MKETKTRKTGKNFIEYIHEEQRSISPNCRDVNGIQLSTFKRIDRMSNLERRANTYHSTEVINMGYLIT